MTKILLGKDATIHTSKLTRHGFIAGATGSGKTVTLKVITEQLSKEGVPVFLSDIKGDLSSLAQKGNIDENIAKRINEIGLKDYDNRKFEVEFFDIFGEKGIPLRTTISEMGPILLSKILGLNENQEGILNIAFKIADERQLLLIDIKDLRAMLNFVSENRKELSTMYGNISTASVGAILRSILVLEQQGGNLFFGEPDFDIKDFFRVNSNGEGIINILNSEKLITQPRLYTTFMLWLLSEMYENLPEIGDTEKPKIVFFFDEAHLIFENNDHILTKKIESIIRLIRSKGVGIFFVSQKATDLPDGVLSQIGTKIQHTLRAYTPKEQKTVKAIAASFRQVEESNLFDEILNLKIGEAIFSTLSEDSKPTYAIKTLISPPESKMGVVDYSETLALINSSILYEKYAEYIDKESAFEILAKEKERVLKEKEQKNIEEERHKKEVKIIKMKEKEQSRKSSRMSLFERFTGNIISSIGRAVGREITRGIFGTRR